jgi:hypothetical protein
VQSVDPRRADGDDLPSEFHPELVQEQELKGHLASVRWFASVPVHMLDLL